MYVLQYSICLMDMLSLPLIYGYIVQLVPDSKIHGANMGPIWGRQDPGGTHVVPMNFAIWDYVWITT